MAKNKVTFGLEKVHVAFEDTESLSKPAWKTPVAIPGAVKWTPEAQGESNTFYADNGAYFVTSSNNGYTGELELALVPDEILAEMLGWEIDNNGMLVEISDAIPKKFALLGQVQGDQKNRRFVYYDCQANRPSKERTTKGESIEVATDILNMIVSPIEIGGKTIVKGDIELNDTNAAAYSAFFSAVTTPTFGAVIKTSLEATIALAGTLTEATYTAETWAVLEAALATATEVNASGSAVQSQVDHVDKALEAAIVGLVVA